LHRALDLGRLEQRGVGVHRDLELAAAALVHVAGELGDVLGVEVARRVGGGQVPLGLRKGCAVQAKGQASEGNAELVIHERSGTYESENENEHTCKFRATS
jgi:hypothetical protein